MLWPLHVASRLGRIDLACHFRAPAFICCCLRFPSSAFPLTMDTKDGNMQTSVIQDDPNHHPMDDLDPTGVLVKPKWRGTSHDKMDMENLGRNQVLRVRRQSRCLRPRSSRRNLLTSPFREIFDFYPCSDSHPHSFALGRSYWRETCAHDCQFLLWLTWRTEISYLSASTVAQRTCSGATSWSRLLFG